jgi:amino acid adenylation domain-containing protein/non-ribosomal peptide synthase protein (TIGR01720 family)
MNETNGPHSLQLHAIAQRFAALSREDQRAFLRRLADSGVDFRRLPIVRSGHNRAPLSSAQRGLWFARQGAAYNLPAAVRLKGALRETALEKSFDELIRRHESLRTTFRQEGERILQVIHEPGRFDLRRERLGAPPVAVETELRRRIDEEAQRPFDLEAGPPLRVTLVELAPDDHLLLVTIHHIVADAASMQILIDEFASLYARMCCGATASLPDLPIRYADYAHWQQSWLDAGGGEPHLAYWRAQLGAERPILTLLSRRRQPVQSDRCGARLVFQFDDLLTKRLRTLARACDATLFMTLLAAFDVVLYRSTGQEDIRIGVPVANRNREETKGVIGLFVDVQLLRAQIDGRLRFADVVARVKAAAAGAQAHQDLPFERVVEALHGENDGERRPAFQILFNHLRHDLRALRDLPELEAEFLRSDACTVKFDLALDTTEDASGRLAATFTYASDMFDPADIAGLRDHFENVLRHVVEDRFATVDAIELLGRDEKALLLGWSDPLAGTGSSPPSPSLSELLSSMALAHAEREAVWCGGEALTYGALERRALRLAALLRRRGVGRETRVGLALERSVDFVVAVLAVIKAGGAYVPLDIDYPPERLAFLMRDAGVALLLTQSHVAPRLPIPDGVPCIALDALDDAGLAPDDDAALPVAAHDDQLAYVIYTSGSTGTPKGVAVSHGALLRHCRAIAAAYGMDKGGALDRDGRQLNELLFMSFAFDGAQERLLTGLLCGARLVLRDATLWTPAETYAALRRHAIDIACFPPAYLQHLSDHARTRAAAGEEPPRVSIYTFGGDAVTRANYDLARQALRPRWLINGYGPTETVVTPLLWKADAQEPCDGASAPIGRPVGARRAFILDGDMNLAPIGAVGELYIGGDGAGRSYLARGYLGRPGLTAERFTPDPFGAAGARLYRSGDLARYREDGVVECLGRSDEQVKLRGFRIELGEIEALLTGEGGVSAATAAVFDGASGKRLIGYVTSRDGAALDVEALRANIKRKAPDYLVPAQIVQLDELPLTPNGKIDRRRLPEPRWTATGYIAPRDDLETRIAEIWQNVLGVEKIGLTDEFFQLGGHSLLAMQIVLRVRNAFDVDVPLPALFEARDFGDFAQRVRDLRDQAKGVARMALRRADRNAPPPLSPAQSRLWFLWRLEPSSAAYNIPAAARLKGRLDQSALTKTFQSLIERHETLRTTFRSDGGEPVQIIHDSLPLDLTLEDMSGLPIDEREKSAHDLAVRIAHLPFDLETGPLLRVCLVRLAEDEHVLLLAMHHIVSDGWSLNVFIDEFAALYASHRDGRAPHLPPLPIQYADFAVWSRDWLAAGAGARQLAYWRERLGGEDVVLQLPTDRPRPAEQSYRGANLRFDLDPALTERLRALAAERGVTLPMLLLASFDVLVHRYTQQTDVRVGITIANRNHVETEGLIGFFVNMLVLRADLGGDPTFEDVLNRVKEAALAAQAHQDLPFEQLVEELRPKRSLGHNPLFQIAYDHQWKRLDRLDDLSGLAIEPFEHEMCATQFDLLLHTFETAGRLSATFTYSVDLFERAAIERMADHWRNLLQGVIEQPGRRIADLPLLGVAERAILVEQWNDTDAAYSSERCLHHLIEAQAASSPDAIAVVFEESSIAYGALDARANRLARKLRELGVGPDVLVGVAAERSLELVVSLLAVLKAGGAYVPIDPDYPAARLSYMIEDSGVSLLLTQERLLDSLPLDAAAAPLEVWRLDGMEAELEAYDDAGLDTLTESQNLAYCIYTSGSTGRPKGAGNTHRGLINRLQWMQSAYGLAVGDRVLQKTPFSFDVSVWEFFWPLTTGATLIVAPPGAHKDPFELGELIRRHDVTTLHFVPSMLQAFVDSDQLASCRSLRRVICSGEALPYELQRQFLRSSPAALHNLYGPTEAAIDVSYWTCREEAGTSVVPIGQPIWNTQLYILSDEFDLVPAGVVGELYIGGAGLARGYHQRPGLTAERFVPDPFARRAGERLYRTGDLARRRADGVIEYVGRIDHQVKIRGFRIELGEIEARLCEHEAVREAVVLARDAANGRQLVGYVVADEAGLKAMQRRDANASGVRVEEWETVFDGAYSLADVGRGPSFAGWNSSYDDSSIPQAEMQEWLNVTLARIDALKPDRTLEIGCGVGLLLQHLAPRCSVYEGADVSGRAIADLRAWLDKRDGFAHVRLSRRAATQFEGLAPNGFDVVLLNSVAQYFPDVDYLVAVLRGALDVLAPGGAIFVGDLRTLALQRLFHASVQTARAPEGLGVRQLKSRIARAIAHDGELLVAPEIFSELASVLPRIGAVEIELRRGRSDNELTRYRYDAILRADVETAREPCERVSWNSGPDMMAALDAHLAAGGERPIRIESVPNRRLAADLALWRAIEASPDETSVETLRGRMIGIEPEGADPESFWTLAEAHGYRAKIAWTPDRDDGCFDVEFAKPQADAQPRGMSEWKQPPEFSRRWDRYTNDPMLAKSVQSLGAILRESLSASLPDYMTPAQILVLDKFPLTANGKLDRQALAAPEPEIGRAAHVAPATEQERQLAEIWQDILQIPRVGLHDNFFDLGGDSIISIQVVNRARRIGIRIAPRDLFQHQTIQALARVATIENETKEPEPPAAGLVYLTPAQHWFFEQDVPERHHWNQSVLLRARAPLDAGVLAAALRIVVERHDALRLRYRRDDLGRWTQEHAETEDASRLLTFHRLAGADEIEAVANEVQASLDLRDGPLMRAASMELQDGSARLLLVIHHLVADGVSWRVLLEDLQAAYCSIEKGEFVRSPPKSSSFQRWSAHLAEAARSEELMAELDYWKAQLGRAAAELPRDFPAGDNRIAQARQIGIRLDRERTRRLLKEAPAVYRTQINDLLLTALARALCAWTERDAALVLLEGHGREEVFGGVDVSRTLGWFTTMYPVCLAPGGAGDLGAAIKSVKEQLRAVPNKGLGYGLLRYLATPEIGEELKKLPQARVTFNYLGQFDQSFEGGTLFEPASESGGRTRSAGAPLDNRLLVNCQIYDGELGVAWHFSEGQYRPQTIERLASAYRAELEAIIDHCVADAQGGVTPSDFPLVRLTQEQVDRLPAPARRIEDVYPLSPVQKGILFHALRDPQSRAYANRLSVAVEGLDIPRFERAWADVLARHAILRTAFAWQGLPEPVQIVHRGARLPFRIVDWRNRDAGPSDLAALERELGAEEIDFLQPPLQKLVLARLGERRYRLIWSHHHILMDGWSTAQLIGEVLQSYHGGAVSPPIGRYRDYIAWLQGRDAAASEAFWKGQLRLLDEPCLLADVMRRTDADEETGYGVLHARLDPARTRALKAFAQRERVTLNTLVQGAWLLLLQRYTGKSAVAFGATVAGRPAELAGVESVLGLFINTLPIVRDMRSEQRVGDFLRELQAHNLAVRDHESTPLYEIQRWAGRSGEALFDSIVVFENYPVDRALRERADVDLVFGKVDSRETTHYPLTLTVTVADRLEIAFGYRACFAPPQIEVLRSVFARLLERLGEDADRELGAISLTDASTSTPLQPERAGDRAYPATCVHRLIERQAERTPLAPAVICGDAQLSYAELDVRANRLAHRLCDAGIGPEALVAIAVERSFDMIVGLLAIWKAGGAYAPLDPDYPRERLAFMLEDSGAALLLTQKSLAPLLPQTVATLLLLDETRGEPDGEQQGAPAVETHPENLAYCIYTSGSTGQPKGAANSHAALCNRLLWMQDVYGLTAGDRVLQKTPFSFDVSVWELFWPLIAGAALVMAPPGAHRRPAELREAIDRHAITTLHFVPSMLQAFLETENIERRGSLQRVLCSGEALSKDLQDRFLRQAGASPYAPELHNLYGPTEAAIDVTYWRCRAEDGSAAVPIGHAIANVTIHILDSELHPLPEGIAGELYIGGSAPARGYHARAALTAERFLPDPFAPGGRLYRTGDLARRRADGAIDYVGRVDQQVKIRGLRIELGEIESRLREHGAVGGAAVVAQEAPAGMRLVGYVTAQAEAPPELEETLRAHLSASLPDYMVPARIVVVERMPLTPSGKLDRKALPNPDWTGEVYVAPRTELEEKLAGVWRSVLRLERVGVEDNFFRLGGDSIISIQVVSRALAAGLRMTPKDVFEHQTIAALARAVRWAESEDAPAPPTDLPLVRLTPEQSRLLPLPAAEIEDIYPLSPMQQGMLFHSVETPGAGLYVSQMSVSVEGLDVARFERAWASALERHAILRTGFAWQGLPAPVQIVRRSAQAAFRQLDWRDRVVGEAELAALAADERRAGFDFTRPPLQRIVLARLDDDRHRLIWSSHHILLDGWSISQLVGEVFTLYRDGAALPAAGRYRDYIAWLQGRDTAASEAFWKEQMRLLGEPCLLAESAGRIAGGAGGGHGALYTRLDAEQTRSLKTFAQRERVTLNTLVQGAWLLLLQRYTGRSTVAFGATVAGRPAELPGVERLLGLFINTLPIVRQLRAEQRVGDFLRELQAHNLAARDHEYTPLNDIQRWAGRSGQALFDSIIVFENYPVDRALQERGDRDLRFGPVASTSVTSLPMDLMVTVGDTLAVEYLYLRDCFEAAAVERLKAHFERLLSTMAEDGDARLGELDAMPADEKALLLGWSDPLAGTGSSPPSPSLSELLSSMALAHAEREAVWCGGEALTYGALERRALRLAALLRRRGVGRETRVGLALERSVDFVVAVLAVIKAGGAYVPLDIDYPPERLAFLMRDAGVALLLTQSHVAPRLPIPDGVPCIALDALDDAGLAPDDDAALPVAAHDDQLAYVIYTSGSTGTPKGVAVSHGALLRHCRAIAAAYGMDKGGALDRDGRQLNELLFMSFAFDGAQERLLTGLLCGARLVLRDATLWTPAETYAALRRHAIDIACFPPAYLQHLSDHARTRAAAGEEPPRVSIYTFGGDAVTRANYDLARQALRPRWLINGYGPTETVVTPLLWKADAQEPCDGASAPIGRPVGARRAFILDGDMNLAPIGAVGELYIGGDGAGRSYLARGYLGRPGLTAERFTPDPFGAAGARLYRSGDLARYREDGVVECLGRSDEQVKLRGFRIELGEIEALLTGEGGVSAATAAVFEGASGKRLIGYVMSRDGVALDVEALRANIGRKAPDHLVPAQIVQLDELPLTPNGKIDRRRLPEPRWSEKRYIAPRDDLEKRIAEIWQNVLGVQKVGVTTNFFEAGGDSILSLRVIAEIRNSPDIDLDIKLRDLMQFQTIAELVVRRAQFAPAPAKPAPRGARVEDGEFDLIPIQRWFFEEEMAEPHHYNQSLMVRTRETLRPELLEEALQSLIAYHDSFRLRFRRGEDGVWRQSYADVDAARAASIENPMLWVREAEDARAVETISNEAQRSLDLERGPLLRAVSMRLPDGGERLLIVVHHLVVDGVSWRILLEDLQAAYRRLVQGATWDAPHKTDAYRLWAERLTDRARGFDLQAERPYWRKALDPHGIVDLPRDNPRGKSLVKHGKSVGIRLDRETTQNLLKVAPEAYRTQINDLLLAALAIVLCRWSGQPSALVQLEGHGREDLFDDIDVTRTVGWFTSAFPVRLTPNLETGPGAVIGSVKKQLAALPHHGVGYGLLRYLADEPTRLELARSPQARITFNYLGQFDQTFNEALFEPAAESAGDPYSPQAPLANWLEIVGRVYDGELSLRCIFSKQVYRTATIERLMTSYRFELEKLIGHCVDMRAEKTRPHLDAAVES